MKKINEVTKEEGTRREIEGVSKRAVNSLNKPVRTMADRAKNLAKNPEHRAYMRAMIDLRRGGD